MKITKLEAAGSLLDTACDHFLRGDWITAIHCAGAVEELCGRYAEAVGGTTVPDGMWVDHDLTSIVSSKAKFVKGINYYRDWVKHTRDALIDAGTRRQASCFWLRSAAPGCLAISTTADAGTRI